MELDELIDRANTVITHNRQTLDYCENQEVLRNADLTYLEVHGEPRQ